MGKFFKSIDELNLSQLEQREKTVRAMGNMIGFVAGYMGLPAVVALGATILFAPAAILPVAVVTAVTVLGSANPRFIFDMTEKLARPYHNAWWELEWKERPMYGQPGITPDAAVEAPAAALAATVAPETFEPETTNDIQVMKPLSLRKKHTVFNTAASSVEARWKTKMPDAERLPKLAFRPA